VATETEVRNFLEQRCHLTRNSKIPEFTEHRDAFRVWRSWLEEGKLSAPFAVVHVDALQTLVVALLGSILKQNCWHCLSKRELDHASQRTV
jgi:hypothetical protein